MLLRDADAGLEVLLLRRNRRTRFAPGAYVFPGGRVDADDAARASTGLLDGPSMGEASTRLELGGADPPAIAYYVAALREAFEEAGILIASGGEGDGRGRGYLAASGDPEVERVRHDLMRERIDFPRAMATLGCRLGGASLAYIAHWITPVRAPLRYDTRFFAAEIKGAPAPVVDDREMTDGRWIAPEDALALHADGGLPMITPTRHTLERLAGFGDAATVLATLGSEPVRTILPEAHPARREE